MSHVVPVRYTNWRGETRMRQSVPEQITWGATKWHPQPQWLLRCWDDEKKAHRELALMNCDFSVCEERIDAVA